MYIVSVVQMFFKDLSFSATSLLVIAKMLRKKLPNGKNTGIEGQFLREMLGGPLTG